MVLTVLPNMACVQRSGAWLWEAVQQQGDCCYTAEPERTMLSLSRTPRLLVCRQQDFFRILTEPEHNMVKQQTMLLATEGVTLTFTEAAIREISKASSACLGWLTGCT